MYVQMYFNLSQISALLRVATLSDHLFIQHHLLRCPPGVSEWAVSYLQVASPLSTDHVLTAQFGQRGEVFVVCECIYMYMYMYIHVHVHVLMRDEKEGRKKQAWSNKQQGKLKQYSTPKAVTFHVTCFNER